MSTTGNPAARLARLEATMGGDPGAWCPACGYGQKIVILCGEEPEPICEACGRPVARGEEIRIIRIGTREDGPQ